MITGLFLASRNSFFEKTSLWLKFLSNVEYDYTIRDLTGVDIRPTREFPIDPANQAGFDNSGETLVMSSTLLNKYLKAARAALGGKLSIDDVKDARESFRSL